MPVAPRALATRALALAWLATTAFLTLQPLGQPTPIPFWSFFAETMSGVDYAQNVVLFLPLGWIASRGRWRVWPAVAAAALVSGGIEFAQQWVPGRTSQASDIVCNTAGAALGWWLASRVLGRRVRLAIGFGTLAGLLGLHLLNTSWPEPVQRVDGAGAWRQVNRVTCPDALSDRAACIEVPNSTAAGSKYARVVGVGDVTYARVQSNAAGRLVTRRDCVMLMFEGTSGTPLRLRPPLMNACDVADSTDRVIALWVSPRLEHERAGEWTPTRAGVWIWPVWPFQAYQPMVQVAAGALAFVVLVSLMFGAATWVIPAGYLVMLEIVALGVGLRGPGWWEVAWALLAWGLGAALVRVDAWWRGDEPGANAGGPVVRAGAPGAPGGPGTASAL